MSEKVVQLYDKDGNNIFPVTSFEAMSGSEGLNNAFVQKSGDIMTGNLTAPKFIGSLQGNASSSTYSTYTYFQDTRNDNEMPLSMLKGISLHLKSNSTDGLNDGLSYHPVLMLRDWNDLTGGPFAELTITGNQNLYFRSSTTNADNTWNPWRKVLTDYNYTSILNNTYLPLTGGTLTGQLKFTQSNGIQTRHIDGESTTFGGDLYLNYGVNAPIHVGHGGAYTISADGSYYSGTAAKVADMPITTITKSLTVTTTWQNTGITSANLATGSYIVQVSGISNGNCGLWGDLFTGVMSWYADGTNGTDADEIILHSSGHARNGGHLFLRILRTPRSDGKTYLQIRALSAASAAQDVVFKFRRVI